MTDPVPDQPFELKRKHVNAIGGTVALALTLLLAGIVIAVRVARGVKLVEGLELVLFLSAVTVELFIGVVPFAPLKEVLHLVLDHLPFTKDSGTPSA